ncbi:hypothetical protein GXW82_41610 [Streptacidiphilus sp. 4-A2]|nr:hypothetical protein [Streptacidiphilus sp. 4-A2]
MRRGITGLLLALLLTLACVGCDASATRRSAPAARARSPPRAGRRRAVPPRSPCSRTTSPRC